MSASKKNKLTCVPIKDSCQPVRSCSLISLFDRHSMGSLGSTFFQAENEDSVKTVQMRRLT